jgi:hypothetical protein
MSHSQWQTQNPVEILPPQFLKNHLSLVRKKLLDSAPSFEPDQGSGNPPGGGTTPAESPGSHWFWEGAFARRRATNHMHLQPGQGILPNRSRKLLKRQNALFLRCATKTLEDFLHVMTRVR